MATNYASASYTEVIDLQTVNNKTSIIGIHTPIGKAPYLKLKGFFQQFKKYRYKGISKLIMAPAAALPVDPLGLTTEVGTPGYMDPRDTFNPILFKGCHGENMNVILNQLFDAREIVGIPEGETGGNPITRDGGDTDKASPSVRQMQQDFGTTIQSLDVTKMYYRLLTDTSWRKFGIQSMVKLRNLHPLVWKVATNHPILPVANGNVYQLNAGMVEQEVSNASGSPGTILNPSTGSYGAVDSIRAALPIGTLPNAGNNRMYMQEFTNGCQKLGWLPTSTFVQGVQNVLGTDVADRPRITALPKLFMGILVMPPSYSQEQFMRMVLRHEFEFSGFQSSTGSFDVDFYPLENGGDAAAAQGYRETNYYNWIDYGEATSKGVTLDILDGASEVISDGVS